MAIPREIRKLIESSRFDALEDAWLGRLAEGPSDLEFFVGIGRALAGTGEEGRARLLLGLLDDELRERGDWEARLELLHAAGELLLEPEAVHPEILATLTEIYRHSPSFAGLLEMVGLRRAPDDLPKTWLKVDRLRRLLELDLGAVVWMAGKGAGRVEEVNLELESFKIDFERHAGLRVGFKAAPKLLRPLPAGHLLRRKLEEPEELERLRDADPPELLRLVLESSEGPQTAGEIRETLAGIVDDAGWTAWWAAVRRHPQVMAAAGGRHKYTWAASGDDAREAVFDKFSAAAPEEKLEIFRREAARLPRLRARMAAELAALAADLADREPATAIAAWAALEKASALPEGDLPWSPDRLIAAADDPAQLLAAIADRGLKERLLERIAELRDDWPAVFRRALEAETHPRVLSKLAESLGERDPEAMESFVRQALSRPRSYAAAFVWLVERGDGSPGIGGANPLRLLQHLLAALDQAEMSPHRARLRALFKEDCLPTLIARLDEDQALRAEEALKRSHLEDFLRTQLLNALHLRFPALRAETVDRLYATPEAIDARRAELRRLLSEEIPANRKAIEEAREMGDLRENFEYKAARQRHEYLTARAEALGRDLKRVQVIDPRRLDSAAVRVGSRVTLAASGGGNRVITILGPWESEPERGVLSYDSDLGRRLLGLVVGERVAIDGAEHAVESIESYLAPPGGSGG